MFRLLLKMILAFALTLAGMTGLILAWPYNAADLLAALPNTDGCPKPCWQRIRPGETPLAEAIQRLEQNAWVDQIIASDVRVQWTWTGQQPGLIDADRPGEIFASEQVVRSVHIPLKIGVGDLRMLLGIPHWRSTNHAGATAIIHLSYPREYLTLSVTTRCPTTRAAFWRTQPEITLHAVPASGYLLTPNLLGQSVAC